MAKIENHKYSIEEAFRECFYIVPDYQREYVWTEKEIIQLLDDINEQLDSNSNREYFIGTILVSPTEQRNHLNVIDGQQRLTTFFLLLCVLKHLFKNEQQYQTLNSLTSSSYVDRDGETQSNMKLDPRYENASEVMQEIVKADGNPEEVRNAIQAASIESFGSLENLVNAYSTIYRYLAQNCQDLSSLKLFMGFLNNEVVFIQISTDVSSALKIFETINERGIGLNPMDLLKNLLFTQVTEQEFSRLRDDWKKVTAPLEKAREKPLRFLRYFLMANYEVVNERSDAIIREDEIYDWLTKLDNARKCGYQDRPFNFVRQITSNVSQYLDFINGRGNDGLENIPMANLREMTGGAFSQHYVLLLAATSLSKVLFDHFIQQLESFLFYYIFTRSPTKDLERAFSRWADELRDIASDTNEENQRQNLNNFLTERFQKGMDSKEAELNDALRRYGIGTMQYYRTRYLLARLSQHVDMAYKGIKDPGLLKEYTTLEIEHILPDNPTSEVRSKFESPQPDISYDEWKNRLGNLTLLEKPINIVASNKFFDEKKPYFAESKCYLTSSIVKLADVGNNSSITRINEYLRQYNDWTAESIETRQEMLIKLAADVWRITPA
jgi:uncharacterized protein with ParB-like and HNH nuclease domain